jgi:hypothetical protein
MRANFKSAHYKGKIEHSEAQEPDIFLPFSHKSCTIVLHREVIENGFGVVSARGLLRGRKVGRPLPHSLGLHRLVVSH